MFAIQTQQAGRFYTFAKTNDKAEAFELKRHQESLGCTARVIRSR